MRHWRASFVKVTTGNDMVPAQHALQGPKSFLLLHTRPIWILASIKRQCSTFHGVSFDGSDVEDKVRPQKEKRSVRDPSKRETIDSDEEDEKSGRWNSQLAWLNNILQSALSLYKRAAPGDPKQAAKPATTRSLMDIAVNLHRSTTTGMQQWGLTDLTFGLYLLSLHHASGMAVDTFKGEQVKCPNVVQELIYNIELAKGAYMKNPAALARISMLRESNIVKFMSSSSVMRPAYYIALDTRQKLVILGIRGTSSVHDVITDLISHSDEEMTFDGSSVHFGTAKAAEWFIIHELETLRHYLQKHHEFGLRLVGHSLGGATASLLAIMLRKKSKEELGFCPGVVSAVAFASPPCVSKTLAIQSADFVWTVVLQDDLISRISAASLLRLRNEILALDWTSFLRKGGEDRKVLDFVAGTVQALSSVQDVARRYTAYANLLRTTKEQGMIPCHLKMHISGFTIISTKTKGQILSEKEGYVQIHDVLKENKKVPLQNSVSSQDDKQKSESMQSQKTIEELFAPGSLYYIRGSPVFREGIQVTEGREGCTLWKGHPDESLGRIVLSGTFLADHKCDSYYQGLRDTLKGLPLKPV